jgi:hypothetical protein
MSAPEWHAVPLRFEIISSTPGLPPGHALTITSVERDDCGIRINYEILPPLAKSAHGPLGRARDDRGRDYEDLGGAFGHAPSGDRTDGVLTMPLPPNDASEVRVWMTWSPEDTDLWDRPDADLWDRPAHEILIRV